MYTPTIGLEVHAELSTKSKMFCGCKNAPHTSSPNQNICPVCMGHPGTLPVPNELAIEYVLRFGLAVKGKLATYSEFDRKNYFYPDIPKAYQLSQYAFPFVKGGFLAGVELTRVHLEEDTARSQHDKGTGSLVDYNRAGVPLMELVTEPVMHDAKTAGQFARELQLLLRTLKISNANMEKGEMRVEANVSVSNSGQKSSKYVEIKNLNSFNSVESAINFEIKRQIELLESGGKIQQETRGWDENKNETFVQRSKETAKDYRYFPDPDILKYNISTIQKFSEQELTKNQPLLPEEKRLKYKDLGLTSNDIETIIKDDLLDEFFSEILALTTDVDIIKAVVNYLITDFIPVVREIKSDSNSFLSAVNFLSLIALVVEKRVTSRVAKDLIIEFANNNTDLKNIIDERKLWSDTTPGALLEVVKETISDYPDVVLDYKSGKVASLQFLIGQVMKKTKGSADPVQLRKLFEETLAS